MTTTMECLSALYVNASAENEIFVFLVDDGSTDGTAAEVAKKFPDVRVIQGSGTLFWSRGMNLAWQTALNETFDAYLWLNDDVVLSTFAVSTLVEALTRYRDGHGDDCIVAGCLTDPHTGTYTYGVALRDSKWHPGRWLMLQPSPSEHILAESFHGNLVLVPHSIVNKIGIIDSVYSHAMGDTDYALRAREAGITIVGARGFIGTCAMNPATPANLRELMGRTFVPPRDWWILTRRHSGKLTWPLAFISPYVGTLVPKNFRRFLFSKSHASPELPKSN